jgi:hypothetical protein
VAGGRVVTKRPNWGPIKVILFGLFAICFLAALFAAHFMTAFESWCSSGSSCRTSQSDGEPLPRTPTRFSLRTRTGCVQPLAPRRDQEATGLYEHTSKGFQCLLGLQVPCPAPSHRCFGTSRSAV